MIYWLPDAGNQLICAVICDDPQEPYFQNAAWLMQEALQIQSAPNSVARQDGQFNMRQGWYPELFDALLSIDKRDGCQWRQFTVATVSEGPHSGLRAIGIGSNQTKLKRASNLALAASVMQSSKVASLVAPSTKLKALIELPWRAVPEAAVLASASIVAAAQPPPPLSPPLAPLPSHPAPDAQSLPAAHLQTRSEANNRQSVVAGSSSAWLGDVSDTGAASAAAACLAGADDSNASEMVSSNGNLGCRVIDAEDVGFSYGTEVLGQNRHEMEGVRRAVSYFRDQGLRVVVVSKRAEMNEIKVHGEVDVLIAEQTEIMAVHHAQALNCPVVVSGDGFEEWNKDPRLSRQLRRCLEQTPSLLVRFSWGAQGSFLPDLDLPTVVLGPSCADASDNGQWCASCKKNSLAVGDWAMWPNRWQWFCGQCWYEWHLKR